VKRLAILLGVLAAGVATAVGRPAGRPIRLAGGDGCAVGDA
jgi:hypothetical protein